MKDELVIEGAYAKQYTDWYVKTGGFARDMSLARDMTLRGEFAGVSLQGLLSYAATSGKYAPPDDELAREAYKMAEAMLKERAK
jgi:hypothetical protein